MNVYKMAPRTTKQFQGGPCGSFLRKGEVFAYVGSIQNLKDLKFENVGVASLEKVSVSETFSG